MAFSLYQQNIPPPKGGRALLKIAFVVLTAPSNYYSAITVKVSGEIADGISEATWDVEVLPLMNSRMLPPDAESRDPSQVDSPAGCRQDFVHPSLDWVPQLGWQEKTSHAESLGLLVNLSCDLGDIIECGRTEDICAQGNGLLIRPKVTVESRRSATPVTNATASARFHAEARLSAVGRR
ncbi:uncharacterized protein EI90DRAFT_3012393 [Cantharellus anzutake]|uniref:uncharacterized protein n=1 Tax=Cantharellus anzutake TaxID=1750568 RepID=UPI0019076A78|nr:uncharacterized protein EI90DRAFT_3012393 [Cantharellus anzutake]KAF8340563.1 hypothetical protein EI90DRAFT_3012393 [Cantharellus anzutake]